MYCFLVFFPAILLRVCFCVAHHRLFGDVHQVLNVVILVLLKGREEHVQHDLPLGPHHLPLRLLLLLVLHLGVILNVTTTDVNTDNDDTCNITNLFYNKVNLTPLD